MLILKIIIAVWVGVLLKELVDNFIWTNKTRKSLNRNLTEETERRSKMSLTIFSKHDANTRANISYGEFGEFRSAFARVYDSDIGECYKGILDNWLTNKDLMNFYDTANYYDRKFEEIFKTASVKKKNVMKFLCKSDVKGSAGKLIIKEILAKKAEIISNAESYQRKAFDLIFSVLENAKDYGIRWC